MTRVKHKLRITIYARAILLAAILAIPYLGFGQDTEVEQPEYYVAGQLDFGGNIAFHYYDNDGRLDLFVGRNVFDPARQPQLFLHKSKLVDNKIHFAEGKPLLVENPSLYVPMG